ncbi:MAG TPA: AzlD domain-containing protein [Candidatus Avamphibacillus sp.]|nr:AzlD domain-containing protein [Candidatus Avamphibacillus sp.]
MTMLLIIIGMSIVTMIPRLIPAFLVGKLEFKSWIDRWLNAIPYAALGALIFPGIMSVKPDEPHIGVIGGVVAIALSALGLNVILVVVGAIFTVFLFLI